jgi:hypothetical protein
MPWKKIIIWTALSPFIIMLILIAVFFVNLSIIGPVTHHFNTKWADEINADTWQNGLADIYTVEAKISINNKVVKKTQDIVFVRKIETEDATFKNGSPVIWDYSQNYTHGKNNPAAITLPVSDKHVFRYRFYPIMERLENIYKGTDSSFFPDGRLILRGTPKTICRFRTQSDYKTDSCQVGFDRLKAFPLRVVSKISKPVHSIITRKELGPADRALMR